MAIVVGLTILSQPWRDLKLKSIDIVQELLDGFEDFIKIKEAIKKNIRGTLMYQVVSKLKGLKGIFKEINHKDDERVYGEQVAYAFLNYYQSLLGTRLENRLQVNVDIMLQGPLVTKQQADFLLSDYTLDEVNKVFFDILGLKAPEPDGYGSYFLEDNWKLVGDDISLAILSFLHFGQMLKEINNMVLTLVPKCKCPNIVGECRPIVCCLNPNPSKSAIYCSGMDDGMVQRVLRAFGFTKSQLPFKYLGIPICAKTISGIECSILVEKMIARIRSWSSRNSSYQFVVPSCGKIKAFTMVQDQFPGTMFVNPRVREA
uniref:Uncharacterized protein n=1 Tax=Cannabis sativa TaxID=3483 RepID=A0A803Q8P5_CANSA